MSILRTHSTAESPWVSPEISGEFLCRQPTGMTPQKCTCGKGIKLTSLALPRINRDRLLEASHLVAR